MRIAQNLRSTFGRGWIWFLALAFLIGWQACHGVGAPPEILKPSNGSGFVSVSGTQFIDSAKHPLWLHGINIINKSKAEGYTKGIEQSDLKTIQGWGMNCIRLGVLWDGLEPQPGTIDSQYLDRIAGIVECAKASGLYVLLDMHQDLYSVKFSDGAPAWATLDDGKSYTPTEVWSDAYYTSEAVQRALDHFWENSPGPDGIGLQDHYARVWQKVAERFRDEPAVVGYDLMNEPFPGRDNARNRQAMFNKLAEVLPRRLGNQAPSQLELAQLVTAADAREKLIEWLHDPEVFCDLLAAGEPIMQSFERERLLPMYQRVRRAIRGVDAHHIIFLEPATSANIGVRSALEPLVDEQGHRDPHQAYAPHAYDIVTDTPNSGPRSSNVRIKLIFARHATKSKELGMPLLIGEWGAYYGDAAASNAARFVKQQIDSWQCSDTYWAYRRELDRSPLLDALKR